MPPRKALVWLRRDLRLEDHSSLAVAEAEGFRTALTFVFDDTLLKPLPAQDRRVSFFHAALEEIDEELRHRDSCLVAGRGDPVHEIPRLAKRLGVKTVIASQDFEPAALRRDGAVEKGLKRLGIDFRLVSDQVIFPQREILNGSGEPYRVFTAYKKAWLARLGPGDYEKRGHRLPPLLPRRELTKHSAQWDLKSLGFEKQKLWLEPGAKAAQRRLKKFDSRDYADARNFPAIDGTSGISAHLRFGTISVRACVRRALESEGAGARTWLGELIWRDFYFMVLSQFPQVGRGEAYRAEHEKIRWPGSEKHFQAWCAGRTGYPLVDAAMRHFNDTGWMHNRLRMVVASFLVKDLLVDWRKGEKYFAAGLLDFDLAANNGGWQWCASTGCDSQPYFRIFNPFSQSKRFDPEGAFIKAQVRELASLPARLLHKPLEVKGYPGPIVDHGAQRAKALALFRK